LTLGVLLFADVTRACDREWLLLLFLVSDKGLIVTVQPANAQTKKKVIQRLFIGAQDFD
jgi:hypothetical protein